MDEFGLTFLEINSLEISPLTDSICKSEMCKFPKNLKVVNTLDDQGIPRKKDLQHKQWKFLAETRMAEWYGNHFQFFTDASKQKDNKTGIGITDAHHIRNCERVPDLMQISNAELTAILKALVIAENVDTRKLVIFTDSLVSCEWITQGPHNNYLVHAIRAQVQRFVDSQPCWDRRK